MTSRMSDRLLTVAEAAEILRTTERFPRRLIAERRIRFIHLGRHVRIPESALHEFIAAGLVEPITTTRKGNAALWPGRERVAADSALSASCRRASGKHVIEGLTEWSVPQTRRSQRRLTLRYG